MPYLIINDGKGGIDNYLLSEKKLNLGRAEENDIVISDTGVSRHHARIVKKGKHFHLTDLESHNGTAVNGKYVHHIKLKNGDEIRIGKALIIYNEMDESAVKSLETLAFTGDSDYDSWSQHMEKIGPEDSNRFDSSILLLSRDSQKPCPVPEVRKSFSGSAQTQADIASLERMNKVLFVLYEISRSLNTSLEFKDLLKKIMDLIFMVINADFGFLVLTGEKDEDELVPIVVKYRDEGKSSRNEYIASRTIIKKVITNRVAVLTSNAMDDSRFTAAESIMIRKIRSAICVPLWEKDNIIGAIQLDSARPENVFRREDLELLKSIGCQMAMVIEQARLNEQIREEERLLRRLERFHSPQIVDIIMQRDKESIDRLMEPKDLTATILFTDIVGFTALSEQMSPREVNQILNHHFSVLTDIIFRHDGTLDKFLGDGLMAIFGAPIEKSDDARRAVAAALEIRREFLRLAQESEQEASFNIRIGINTGRVTAGSVGSPKRMDYTVIGDSVNIAKRLESIASPRQILIGHETYSRIKKDFHVKEVGPRMLKGKSREIRVYEVLD